MAKENASWITELVDTNPLDSDPVAEGNDHLQMIKAVLKNSFPSTSTQPVVPNMSGQGGKFLSNDGTDASWSDPLPSQTGNADKVLTTDGSNASWGEITSTALSNPFYFNGVPIAGFSEESLDFGTTNGTMSCDLSLYTTFLINRNGAITISPTNVPASGKVASFTFITSGSGAITHPTGTRWSNGVSPTLGGGTEIFTYITATAGSVWYGFHAGQAMS